ncbi:MAG: hypothetical protein FJ090_01310 [Deltaproteobacteria bacterium]|nr:hypothetical protein [Deltaproteobacteria bacterium]
MTDTRSARERMRMGRTAVQVGLDRANLLEAWIDRVPTVAHLPGGQPCNFGADLAADTSELTWKAWGEASGMLKQFSEFLDLVGAPAVHKERLLAQHRRLQPKVAGSFIEARSDGADLGWFVVDPLPLEAAVAEADPSRSLDAFASWARETGILQVQGIGRSVGGGMTRLAAMLPGGDAVERHGALAKALGVRQLGDGAAALVRGQAGAVGITLALGLPRSADDAGVADFGVVLAQPDARAVVELLMLAGLGTDATLARFEGFLGVDGAVAVVVGARGGKLVPVFKYAAGTDRVGPL